MKKKAWKNITKINFSILGDILPFRIRVSTTGNQEDTSGFDLSYQQRGCWKSKSKWSIFLEFELFYDG